MLTGFKQALGMEMPSGPVEGTEYYLFPAENEGLSLICGGKVSSMQRMIF